MDDMAFKDGAVLFFEHDVAEKIYIMRSGRVELTREVRGGATRVVNAGEIIGMAETLGGSPRIASARAITSVTATAVNSDEFAGMLHTNVAVGLKLLTSLCAELREIDEVIVKEMRGGMAQSQGSGLGLRMIADHFRDKGMTRAARYAYGKFLESAPSGEQRLDAMLQLGSLCEKDGDAEVALQIYEAVSAEYPDDARPQTAYHRLKSVMDVFSGNS